MLSQRAAEEGLVMSLLRDYDETADAALGRVADLSPSITKEYVVDPSLQTLFGIILDNADRGIATSAPLAAQLTNSEEFDLRKLMASTDRGALRLYIESVEYYAGRRRLTSALDTAGRIERFSLTSG